MTDTGGRHPDGLETESATEESGTTVSSPPPAVARRPPGGDRGPFSPTRWKSPIRGPWLTSVFGLILLIGIPIEFITGLLSYAAYNPRLGDDPNPGHGIFGFYLFDWFSTPSWLYRLNEGVHVVLGMVLVPVVLAKLWSVMPKLFSWPPWRSIANLLERLSLILIVGGVVFEMSTGLLYINYLNKLNFYPGHFYGAWAFIAGFVIHVSVKFGDMVRALRSRSLSVELRTNLAGTVSEPLDDGLVAPVPSAPTISRRGVLALVGGTSLTVFLLTVGETLGGALRQIAVFGTHYRSPGVGANHFPVNHTAESKGVTAADTGHDWRLHLVGPRPVVLSRDELLSMQLTTADLPIACTEGWSTQQQWTGVPLATLARLAGVTTPGTTTLRSIDSGQELLSGSQTSATESMLALKVNGADLSLDHGYPARVIVPSAPGTHNLKWMRTIIFTEEA
jgi:DMSO/TMAO reductase YedYZ molybdopterin-dependent catalytic subunit